jgi:alpha-mannosidase
LSDALFWWESPDGSRVLAFRIPCTYNQEWGDPDSPEPTEKQKLIYTRELCKKYGHDMMGFFGVGNHGGGPTIANLKMMKTLQEEWGRDVLFIGSTDEYFDEMRGAAMNLPVVADDLQHHASGCYSALSAVKKANRLAEHGLLSAEKFSAVAHYIFGLSYPSDRFEHAWQQTLFNQFHDIITGCCIKEAYDDVFNAYGEAMSIAGDALNAAIQKISFSIDTTGAEDILLSKESDWILWEHDDRGVPLVVFNPLSWEVSAPVQVHRRVAGIADDEGRTMPIQHVRAPQMNLDEKWDTLFIGKIPAMGYRVFRIYKNLKLKPDTPVAELSAGDTFLENSFVRIEFDVASGFIKRFLDKRLGVEMLSGQGAVPIVFDETDSDTWAHFITEFDKETGRFGNSELKVLETGPVRARLRVTSRYGNSILQQDFMLYHDRPGVIVKVRLDWRERHRLLKLAFPANVTEPKVVYEIPYGFIERPANGLEEPGQQWVDVSGISRGSGKACGMALLNNCKYSFSAKDNVLSMTVVRSPIYADHFGYAERDEFCEFTDQGVQEFDYVLLPHEGQWQNEGVVRKAYELNISTAQIVETYHRGPLGLKMEGIAIYAENVTATALKLAEDGKGYILRCYETAGRSVRTIISLPVFGRRWEASFGACEIKTFMIPANPDMDVIETNLLEMPLQGG